MGHSILNVIIPYVHFKSDGAWNHSWGYFLVWWPVSKAFLPYKAPLCTEESPARQADSASLGLRKCEENHSPLTTWGSSYWSQISKDKKCKSWGKCLPYVMWHRATTAQPPHRQDRQHEVKQEDASLLTAPSQHVSTAAGNQLRIWKCIPWEELCTVVTIMNCPHYALPELFLPLAIVGCQTFTNKYTSNGSLPKHKRESNQYVQYTLTVPSSGTIHIWYHKPQQNYWRNLSLHRHPLTKPN